MFVGRYTVGVDKDGGFALPEDWRPFIGESRVVCLEMDEEYTCLKLIPESEIDKTPSDKERFEIRIGDDWKIKVPEELRVQASLGNEAVLTGSIRFARIWDPFFLDEEFDDDESSPDLWMERMEKGRFEADYQKVVAWSRGQEKISVAAILREFGILPSEGEPILERMNRDGLLEPGITKKTWIVKKQGGQADSSGDKTITLDDCMCNARDEYEAHHVVAARQWLSRAEGLAQKVDVALLRRMGACAFRHKDFGLARQLFERGMKSGGEPAYYCCLASAAASIAQDDWVAADQSVVSGLKSLAENGEPPGGPYECRLEILRELVQMLGRFGRFHNG